jgi:hypothetical protein
MDRPVFLGDNLFSQTQYPLHVITADEEPEEPVGHAAALVANGRRHGLNFATATTANDPWFLKAVFDQVRGADMLALDRGHNLAGKQVKLEFSDDDFVTSIQVAVDCTIPSTHGTGSLDDAHGVVTEEGAWLKRFPFRAGAACRVYIPAMGAGLRPQIVGLWVGVSYSPEHLFRPSAPDNDFMLVEESVLPSGWRSKGRAAYPRQGAIRLRMSDFFAYERARYHLQFVFGRSWPTWIIHDEDQADRALLADRAGGTELGLVREAGAGWAYPQGAIAYVEREPLAA